MYQGASTTHGRIATVPTHLGSNIDGFSAAKSERMLGEDLLPYLFLFVGELVCQSVRVQFPNSSRLL